MNTKNSNPKYRLLVLMDLSKASEIALKNAVQLAKVIEGSVEAFHVKAPTDVVKYENQFSAMRAIHEDYGNTKSRLRQIIRKIEKENGIPIAYQIAYGNIKKAIKEHISKVQPEIVLLGKRKSKLVNFLGSGVTKFVLKQCSTNILISGEDHKFHSYTDISLGVYGEILQQKGFEIINDLNLQGTNRIRFFKIRDQKDSQKSAETQQNEQETLSYVFSEGSNALDGLASYISRTNTQLFCIPRKSNKKRLLFQFNGVETPLKQVIQKLDIPVLILR